MCGIIAYLSKEKIHSRDIHHMLHNMLWIDTIRGDHSTGIIYQVDGEVDYYKKAIPGFDFVQLPIPATVLDKHEKTQFIIGHNRAATRGNVNQNNAHPFEFDHIIGVHNGTLSNHHSLTPAGVNHPVDSMHLYDAISREGSAEVLPQVDGSFNLIWHNNNTDTIHVCRNKDRPFTFAKLKNMDTMIGASEKGMLKWLVKRHGKEIEWCFTPDNNVEYIFEQGKQGAVFKYIDKIEHKEFVRPAYTPPANNGYGNHVQGGKHEGRNRNVHTTVFGDTKRIEFLLDEVFEETYTLHGQRVYTGYGETADGVEVIIRSILQDEKEKYEEGTWYEGTASWRECRAGSDSFKFWQANKLGLKEYLGYKKEDDDDEGLNICQHCGGDFKDEEVVWVDTAPLCLDCCHTFQVTEEWLDDDEDKAKLRRSMN